MTEPKYRWDHPHDWLNDKVHSWDEPQLRQAFIALLWSVDNNTIQEIFQEEMDKDGYFDPLPEVND